MKTYGGVDVYIHVFLTSAIGGGEWSASRHALINAGGKTPPDTHRIKGWVDLRAVEKIFLTLSGLEHRILGGPARS
jgi:hypothetical protein